MTNITTSLEQVSPSGLSSKSGYKIGYLKATVKAAQNDTVTIGNIKEIIDADLRIIATGAAEPYTFSGKILTLTSATAGSVRGKIIYR